MENVKNEEFNHGQVAVIKGVKIDTLNQEISRAFSFNFLFSPFPFQVTMQHSATCIFHLSAKITTIIVNDKFS